MLASAPYLRWYASRRPLKNTTQNVLELKIQNKTNWIQYIAHTQKLCLITLAVPANSHKGIPGVISGGKKAGYIVNHW